jgi:hypothetical protein
MKRVLVVGLVCLAGCVGRVTGVMPVEEEGVVVGVVWSTPVEPVDTVVLCDTVWVPRSVCWQVRDSVRP